MSDPQATYSVDADGQVQTNYDQASTDGQVPTPKSDEQVPPGRHNQKNAAMLNFKFIVLDFMRNVIVSRSD